MKQQQHIDWLVGQLPDWTQQDLISTAQAEALRQHYQQQKLASQSTVLTFFGMIGAILMGIGIILLFAYNWSDFSRPLRVLISFSLLLGAQGLVAYTLWKKRESITWRESTASFLSLMIAATIALIGQTYHIPGDWAPFLLTCSLLTLPLVYLLRVSFPAILYWVAVLCWYAAVFMTPTSFWAASPDLAFWGLYLLPIPWLGLSILSPRKYQLGTLALAQTAVIVFLIATGMSLLDTGVDWRLLFGACFAVMAMAWHLLFESDRQRRFWQALPATNLGKIGLLGLGLALSFGSAWESYGDGMVHLVQQDWLAVDALSKGGLLIAITGAWFVLGLVCWRKKAYSAMVWAAAPLMIALGLSLAPAQNWLPILTVNLWLLAMGGYKLLEGSNQQNPAILSNGLLLISALILIRFLDSDLSILFRGLAFIGVGALFLIANIIIMKRLAKEPGHEA